ncbi:MAG TPA: NifB/NifX family molybdenum-iron cluster-binding protein [bacterium]|nr:NifB/NifX family molybdenum-iron cluster-binding protein [bacterium]
MKVAISCIGDKLEAAVDPRFGRAQGFLIVDTAAGTVRYMPNDQNLQAVQGAGIQAAQHVLSAGVEALITGNIGPKAFRVLQEAGVRVYTGASGSVGEALEALQDNQLPETAQATKPGHWM